MRVKMGQGDYTAVILGVRNAELKKYYQDEMIKGETDLIYDQIENFHKTGKWNPTTGKNDNMDIRVKTQYEARYNWIGIIIATDDPTLNAWWSADDIDIDKIFEYLSGEGNWKDEFKDSKKLEAARKIWEKVEPILLKHKIIKKEDVNLHIIRDYD
jgi:hypothetical protein